MKIVLPTSPVFTPGVAGAGQLNFTTNGLTSTFEVKRVFAVINQTRNSLIYAETVANLGYVSYNATTKVMVLQADTSLCSSGDTLQVIYDDPAATVGVTGAVEITNDAGNAIPVSAAALPLPTGAATNTTLTDGTQKTQVTSLPSLPAGSSTIGSVNVTGTVPLPTGAALASKQPAPSTAGNPSIDVLTVQGVATGTPQPVSGTVTLGAGSANIGSVNVQGGNATAVKTDGSAVTQPVSAASLPLPAGAATENTLASLRNNLAEQSTELTGQFNAASQSYTVIIAGSNQVQCQSMTAVIPATYFFGGSIAVQGSMDGVTYSNLPLFNLQTNSSASYITSFGETYQFNTTGLVYIRFLSVSWSTGTAYITFKRSQQPSRSASANSVAVTSLPSLPAGTNSIGNVVVTGEVEIKNDTGNPVPISAASLPLPTGAATEATLLALKNAYLNGTLGSTTLSVSTTSLSISCPNSGSVILQISGAIPAGVSITFDASVDSSNFVTSVPFINLVTGASATSITGTGVSVTYLVAVSAVGIGLLRLSTSGTWGAATASVKYVTSEKTVSAASSGSASNVSVTNFPATQPVSLASLPTLPAGTNVIGAVAISNSSQRVTPYTATFLSGGTTAQSFSANFPGYLIGLTFTIDNVDTGYGLEPVYLKLYLNLSSAPPAGYPADIVICLCDGMKNSDEVFFQEPIYVRNAPSMASWAFISQKRDVGDVTPCISAASIVFYGRTSSN